MPFLGFPVFCLSSSIVSNRWFHILVNSMTIWPSPFKHLYSCFGKGCPKEGKECSRQCREVVWEIFNKINSACHKPESPRIDVATTVQWRPTVARYLDERVLRIYIALMKWQYAQAYAFEALSRYPATKTRPKTKGSLAMVLQVHHDFWYISPTFSAKHDIKRIIVGIMLSLWILTLCY